jgi:proline iminopeptidase
MHINMHVDQHLEVKVRGKTYPVLVSGQGMPTLAIGISGKLMQRTLSDKFKSNFTLYSSDLYWERRFKLERPTELTLDQMIDDLVEMGKNLNLSQYVLLGHSAYGIVALEFAKRYPKYLQGLILIGTQVNFNPAILIEHEKYFQTHADVKRRQIDAERRAAFSKEDHSLNDPMEQFLRSYTWKEAPRYWHDPSFDCTPMWQDIILENELFNHFFDTLLPSIDARTNVQHIQCPIFLASGMSDYDSCPWDWAKCQIPATMQISKFSKSGHYPHYEEQSLFDERIEAWLKHEVGNRPLA